MKKIFVILMMIVSFCFTSCSMEYAYADDVYVETYYNDALYTGYEIVWVDGWPYWHHNTIFVPYHHNHVLHYTPTHWYYHTHKPVLVNNRFDHKHQPPHHRPDYRPHNPGGHTGNHYGNRPHDNHRPNTGNHPNGGYRPNTGNRPNNGGNGYRPQPRTSTTAPVRTAPRTSTGGTRSFSGGRH